MDPHPETRPLGRLWRYTRPHRRRVWMGASFSVLNKLFDLAPPVLIGLAIDVVTRQGDSWMADQGLPDPTDQLWALAILTVLIWAAESLFQFLANVTWRNLAQTVQHDLRLDVYGHLQRLEMAWFEDRSTGGLMSILNDDVNQLERFLDHGIHEVLLVGTTVVVVVTTFFVEAPQVAWMAMLPIPIILWGSFTFQKRIAPRYAAVREQVSILNGQLANNLGGMATIKSFTTEAHETERVREESQRYRERNRDAIRLSSAFSPLIRMAIVVGFTATIVYGGVLTLEGELNPAVYAVLTFLTQRLLWPLTRLGETFDLYQRAMASAQRAFGLLDTKPGITDGAAELPTAEVAGALRFERVGFAYSNGLQVLEDLDLEIEAGKTTAVVGPTGSGKTTLVKLLLRFYEVTAGRITLDGRALPDLRLADLRASIGLVSQDVFLFHGSVRDNIAYGRLEATGEEIEAAARMSEAHGFIMSLPQGYDTIVGERGQKLSGGQRQRISIARAILKDPPILVLDEATSAVDNETEAAIQRSLERIAVGRTTLVIAHRLSTVRNADRIYVLEKGRLAEQGHHDTLLDEGGVYAALWRVQTGERGPDALGTPVTPDLA